MSGFAELVAATNFSFLRGASHPQEMVATAAELGLAGIGIADRNSVAGVVRAHVAARELASAGVRIRLAVGARLVFADGTPDVVVHVEDRAGWGRLTRLLTRGKMRERKGDCRLFWQDLADGTDGLLLLAMPGGDEGRLGDLKAAAPGRLWLAATMPRRGTDRRRLAHRIALARRLGVPMLASNDALHASAADRPMADILACIREGVTIQNAGRRLWPNAERHLKGPAEMARLFRDCPEAVRESLGVLERACFCLDELRYHYPEEPVPDGWTAQGWLEHLVEDAARRRWPHGMPERARAMLAEEFRLIGKLDYAPYFLTVHDIVRFAQERGILCQGRGSAANSLVCYLLGITAVDPVRHDLLFSRFLSEERAEPPDIDVDFEHERREEVMQYVFQRYGRERAAIAATVIRYRPRSAVREVGKALGLTEDVTARIAGTVWGQYGRDLPEERFAEAGLAADNPEIARLSHFVDRLLGFPRHLSQHVGGFVLTADRLDETVPIGNAAMPDRSFIEWDKDDIDALGLMKVDVLALGMLTAIAKGFQLMRAHGLGDHGLDSVPPEDPATYEMLCRGDSVGVFQVESRAQINMLPRLRPREFHDLVVQIAIVRPGPIEGDMVHPYLRRRAGLEPADLPSPAPPHDPQELRRVLGRTYGVPLFQEQAMKLAIVAAEFSADEANGLRRAMATFRNRGGMEHYRDKLVGGMVRRGYDPDFAERCFRQIEGFGSYGFPESHAQAFARLVYVSAWMKCHHPAVFACALLNAQPMGFYAPAQLVADARAHGVAVRGVDANASHWDCTLEPGEDGALALRLGFRMLAGFRQDWADALVAARDAGAFDRPEALVRRAGLPAAAVRLLADGDALGSMAPGTTRLARRPALWEARRTPGSSLPLFAASKADALGPEPDAALPTMPMREEVVADYQTAGLSLKGHPVQFLRPMLAADGVLSAAQVAAARDGQWVKMAGVVLVRQRPGKGHAVFITLEDETGIVNVLLWARLMERQRLRQAVMAARLMQAEGQVQRSREGVVHLMARRVRDRTADLLALSDTLAPDVRLARGDEVAHPQPSRHQPREPRGRSGAHPRDVRILPRSRDFH